MNSDIYHTQDEIVTCILHHARVLRRMQASTAQPLPPPTWYPILLDLLSLRRCVANRLGSHAAFLFRSILLDCYPHASRSGMLRMEFSADCVPAHFIDEAKRALLSQRECDSLYLHHEKDVCTQTRERWILARRLTVSQQTGHDLAYLSLALCFWYYMVSRISTQSPHALAMLYLRIRRRILQPNFLACFAQDCAFDVRGDDEAGGSKRNAAARA